MDLDIRLLVKKLHDKIVSNGFSTQQVVPPNIDGVTDVYISVGNNFYIVCYAQGDAFCCKCDVMWVFERTQLDIAVYKDFETYVKCHYCDDDKELIKLDINYFTCEVNEEYVSSFVVEFIKKYMEDKKLTS